LDDFYFHDDVFQVVIGSFLGFGSEDAVRGCLFFTAGALTP